jgi:glyoxylase-like metal-dependent hydrolase (beta-lactamase superfamily II)
VELETYRFRTGSFECLSLNDGYHDYKVEGFFEHAPPEEVLAALEARDLPTDRIPSTYSALFVDTGKNKALIDTGMGRPPDTGHLPAALQKEGIDKADIDTLIITHMHGDHSGGMLDGGGNPAYPNARIYLWKRERDFWFSESAAEKFPSPEAIEAYRTTMDALADLTVYIEPDCEIVPGLEALAAPGHTPGHYAVMVRSDDAKLCYISDTVFHPLHLEHPEWLPSLRYRPDPDAYEASRKRILDMVAEENALVHAMHFTPFPSLGHVRKETDGWSWHPVTE